MNCDLHQDRILDYETLTAAEQHAVDAHLQVCPECRELARQWRALDAALAQQLHAPAVSECFDAQVRQRITSEAMTATEAGLAERRRGLEAEYAASRQLHHLRQWIPQALDVLGFGVAGGLSGWVAVKLLMLASAAWHASPALTGPQSLVISSATGLVIALGSIALTTSRMMRRVWLR